MNRFPDIDPVRGKALLEDAAQTAFGKSIGELSSAELLLMAAATYRKAADARYENEFQALVARLENP